MSLTLNTTDFLAKSLHSFVGEKFQVKTTLGRLIKILAKLDAEISKSSRVSHSSSLGQLLQTSTSRVNSHEQVIIDLHARKAVLVEELSKKVQLEMDRLLIKTILHERNSTLKVDLIQSQLVMLKYLKDDLESTLNALTANQIGSVDLDQLSETHLVDLEERSRDLQARTGSLNPPTLTLSVFLVKPDEIMEMLEKVNQHITDLEDERDLINTRTKVSLELHPVTIKVLGLKPVLPKISITLPPSLEDEV